MRKLRLRTLLCFSLACTASLSPTLAAAAPSARSSEDDATVAMARERFKEGVAYFDKKDFEKARLAFLQAYALKKHPAVLLNLAQSELRSGHEAEAAKHFSAYLREATDASPSETQAATAGLSAAKVAVAELEVNVDETGAEVSLDGTVEGISPLPGPLYVPVGSHSVEARKGGKSVAQQINASGGKQIRASLTLTPKAAPVAAAPVAAAPAPEREPEPQRETEPAPSAEPEPVAESAGRKPFFKWLFTSPVGLVGFSLTGIGVGGGIGFALASHRSYSNSDSVANQIKSAAAQDSAPNAPNTANLCSNPKAWLMGVHYPSNATPSLEARAAQYGHACSLYPDNVNKGNRYKTLSTVGFVVGGAAALGTVLLYFVDPGAKETANEASARSPKLSVLPEVAAGQAGLTLLGTF